jgi:hypothetical protein
MQNSAYSEFDELVGELRADLEAGDELVLVSDHGLQDGVHTDEAMIAATDPGLVEQVDSVLDIRGAVEAELDRSDHTPASRRFEGPPEDDADGEAVREQLQNLGYME